MGTQDNFSCDAIAVGHVFLGRVPRVNRDGRLITRATQDWHHFIPGYNNRVSSASLTTLFTDEILSCISGKTR